MTLAKARNELVAEAAQSFYNALTPDEQFAVDAKAERLRDAIKAKMPSYQISTASLREAVFAITALTGVASKPGYQPKDHLEKWLNTP